MSSVGKAPREVRLPPGVKRHSLPPWARWGLIVAVFVAGPIMLVVQLGHIGWRTRAMSATAEAEVVEVKTTNRSNISYCPKLRWSADGKAHEAWSSYCGDAGDFEAGQRLRVRYAPSRPDAVVPDTAWALYGDAIFIPVHILFTVGVILVFVGTRKRRARSRSEAPDPA